ncbi:MAG: gamma-glutamyltransferase, partial [Balneolaceae bacterium]
MRTLFTLLFALLFLFQPLSDVSAQVGWTEEYEQGVVVAAEKHAAEVGREILEEGGNAVDAAVAVQFALSVTLPRAGNIGGGGFMVIRMADGTTTALDYREKAPLKASEDMYIRDGEYRSDLSREGILAVGVPGVVDGMVKAIERYGRFPLQTVVEPSIKLAREGYELSWKLADELNANKDQFKKFKSSESYFTKKSGSSYEPGDLFVQEDLANTLERIARYGRGGFYSGKTADLIVEEMKRHNGLIGYRDLRNYESVWRDPVRMEFNDYQLHIMPPPSSGSIAIAQILASLEEYDLREMGFNSAEYVHLITESMRRAFADRAHYLGDPDFVDIPREELLEKRYNRNRMQSFDPDKATDSEELGHGDISGFSESSETTHFSIVDSDGNAVAVTTTLNASFGSKVAVSGAGFLLNNEMDDFTAEPEEPNMFGLIQGEANAIEPEKR